MDTLYMIGNAHLDPVWLWRWQEGYQEVKATFRSALDRMRESPEYVFTCACAAYYKWVEENEPEMFEEIRARVAEGRWVLAGGMWIQPDMNTPSGESLARQILYSQRYFREKFGRIARIGYNVDSFGHNAQMPQIYRKAAMEGYVWMRPMMHENADIPEGCLLWEGIDGTRLLAYRIHGSYCWNGKPVTEKIETQFGQWEKLKRPVMCFYGVGNHGGGPTKENLRQIEGFRREDPRGDRVRYGSPEDFFDELRREDVDLPLWKGELQHHASGCYSTHSRSKRLHRQAENALLRMESFAALSRILTGHEIRAPFVRQAWEDLLFNEFHDIMGGCSLETALEDACIQLSEALAVAAREENAALQKISWRIDTSAGLPGSAAAAARAEKWNVRGNGTPVAVFNPHTFDAVLAVEHGGADVRDESGAPVPCQMVRSPVTFSGNDRKGIFLAKVPALGYRLFWAFPESGREQKKACVRADTGCLENEMLRAEFDPVTGALIHLIRKDTGFDALTGAFTARLMDIEACDTWAHGVFRFDREAGAYGDARIRILEDGPVRALLQVITRYSTSRLEMRYALYAGADQLEAEVLLENHETFRMTKLCWPTAGTLDVAEIPCGALVRRGNGDEEHCQRWAAVQGEAGGLAVLNDGKYSYSVDRGEMRLTACNTNQYSVHEPGQRYRDDSCRFMDLGEQRFHIALVPFSGSWRDAGLARRAENLNREPFVTAETYHEGPLGPAFRGLSVLPETVSAGAVKRAENGRGWVLRLWENAGKTARAAVDAPLFGRRFETELKPFEIKTLFLPDDPVLPEREILITELDAD